MEERIEEGWKAFERVGGRRQKKVVGFKEHLEVVHATHKLQRERAAEEYHSRGEATDYSKGSALHDAKDERVKKFVKGQLDRAHMLRRFGDPTPLKQSGTFNRHTNTFQVFNKTVRQVKRSVANDERFQSVKEWKGRGQRRTMWDLRDDAIGNINSPDTLVIRDQHGVDLAPRRKKRRTE